MPRCRGPPERPSVPPVNENRPLPVRSPCTSPPWRGRARRPPGYPSSQNQVDRNAPGLRLIGGCIRTRRGEAGSRPAALFACPNTADRRLACCAVGGAIFGNQFQSRVFVGTSTDAYPISVHDPLMANFLDCIFCHCGPTTVRPQPDWHLGLTGVTVLLTGKRKPRDHALRLGASGRGEARAAVRDRRPSLFVPTNAARNECPRGGLEKIDLTG